MTNLRKYGQSPFRAAVVHGGPGAAGEMAPVARELGLRHGILEPLQTASTLKGQVEELKSLLEADGQPPLILIGFSWGAWLSYITAARYPFLVKKLILVSSGPFEERYADKIPAVRMSRLSADEKAEVLTLMKILNSPSDSERNTAFRKFGELLMKADAYDADGSKEEGIDFREDIFRSVWNEASELRKTGRLLELGLGIQCPVLAVHGCYDPHPASGVEKPLTDILKEFRFILLEKCGHRPWIEKQAHEEFFKILNRELE